MTSLFDPADTRPIHFVGIAGAGMSALAELFALRGVSVTGCDQHPENAPDLARAGHRGRGRPHDPAHVDSARALVVTSAMPKDHPELARARELGLPVVRRAEALGEATAGTTLVGVAGTHGKSTTTVHDHRRARGRRARSHRLRRRAGHGWGGNLRAGQRRAIRRRGRRVRPLLPRAPPTIAVVTNLEADHLDIYADLADLHRTFAQFVARRALRRALRRRRRAPTRCPTPASAEVIRYGLTSRDARLRAIDLRREGLGTRFTVEYDGEVLGDVALAVPGEHNVRNALAAVAAGLGLGLAVPAMAPGLAAFRGVERRFQLLGERRRRARRRRLRASSHRGARDARGRAQRRARAPARRRLPAASLLAHARLRARVRRGARA